MTFKRVGSGLAGMVARWIDDPELQERLVHQAWSSACGAAIAEHTRVISFKDGVLRVRVDEPRWMPTLRDMHAELLEKVRTELGRESVQKLEWAEPAGDDDPGHRPQPRRRRRTR
jgi:predicted nucleic acid-binding Zn ribbon protein